MEKRIINRDFFEKKAEKVARELLGKYICYNNKEYQITKTEGRALLYEASPFCLFFILPISLMPVLYILLRLHQNPDNVFLPQSGVRIRQ